MVEHAAVLWCIDQLHANFPRFTDLEILATLNPEEIEQRHFGGDDDDYPPGEWSCPYCDFVTEDHSKIDAHLDGHSDTYPEVNG